MAIGDALLRTLASLGAEKVAESAVDSAEEYASGFGQRHPRGLRFLRIVGGALLMLNCFYFVVPMTIILATETNGTTGETMLVALFALFVFAWGIASFVWGFRLVRRGLREGPSMVETQDSRADAIALRDRYERER